MRKALLLAALAIPAFTAAHQPSARPAAQTAAAPAVPRYSQEQLNRIRQSLVAQVAVRDQAEQAYRVPTAEEAATLAASAPQAAAQILYLADGSVALRADLSQASLAVAEIGEDGIVTIGHTGRGTVNPTPTAKTARDRAISRQTTGGADVR
jgi:hypothetical protein